MSNLAKLALDRAILLGVSTSPRFCVWPSGLSSRLAKSDRQGSAARCRFLLSAVVCLLLMFAAKPLRASFSLTFQGHVQTLNTGGSITLSSPAALVVDTAGNIYMADTNNSRIVQVNPQGVASVLTISGLSPAALSSPFRHRSRRFGKPLYCGYG